jgi:hypothetical protein
MKKNSDFVASKQWQQTPCSWKPAIQQEDKAQILPICMKTLVRPKYHVRLVLSYFRSTAATHHVHGS